MSVLDRSLFTPIGDGAYNDPDHMRRFDYTSIPATTSNVVPVPVSDPTIPQDDPQVEETGLGPDEFMIDGTIFTVGADFEERVKSREIDGVTLYPIINAPGAEFGSNVERILREFTQEDVPFGLGTFDDRGTFFRPEDVGSTVQDTGLDLLNIIEAPVRGLAGFIGEFVSGPKGKKEFQSYIPEAPSDLDRGLTKASYIGEITDFTDPISEIEKDDENIKPTETVTEKTPEELEAEQQMTIDKGLQEIYELSKGTVADPQAGLKKEPEEGEDDEDKGESKQQKALNLFQFDDPKVNRFLRNVGSALVKEGQFTGLGTGAAAFAEEEAQRDLLEEERMIELIKAGAEDELSFGDISKISDKGAEVNEYIKNFEGANASIGIMNDVITLFEEAQKKGIPVTGVRGRLSRLSDQASAFLNLGGEPGTATKIKNMIEVVKNRQIREILGESGRTISDLDRRIVDKVFGEIDLTTSPEIALKKLRDAREQLKSSARQYQRDVRTGSTALSLPQSGQLGQTYMSQYSDLINDILKIDVDQLDVAGYNPTIGEKVIKIPLTEKT